MRHCSAGRVAKESPGSGARREREHPRAGCLEHLEGEAFDASTGFQGAFLQLRALLRDLYQFWGFSIEAQGISNTLLFLSCPLQFLHTLEVPILLKLVILLQGNQGGSRDLGTSI